MRDQPTINIEVRAEGPGAPLDIRLRRALKWLLRSHGLRAVRVSDVEPMHKPANRPTREMCLRRATLVRS